MGAPLLASGLAGSLAGERCTMAHGRRSVTPRPDIDSPGVLGHPLCATPAWPERRFGPAVVDLMRPVGLAVLSRSCRGARAYTPVTTSSRAKDVPESGVLCSGENDGTDLHSTSPALGFVSTSTLGRIEG